MTKEQKLLEEQNTTKLLDCESKSFTMEEIEKMIAKKLAQREINKVQLAGKLVLKDIRLGAEKKDKEGNLFRDTNGETIRWDSTYTCTFAFVGGEIKTDVSIEQFEKFEEQSSYLCEGYISEVRDFGNTFMGAKFTRFTKLS